MNAPLTNLESIPQLVAKFHTLRKGDIVNAIEKGRVLTVLFDRHGHGGHDEYHRLIKTEFAMSERHARRYRDLYQFCAALSKSDMKVRFDKLKITVSALMYMTDECASAGRPEKVDCIREVIEAAKRGDVIGRTLVEEIMNAQLRRTAAARRGEEVEHAEDAPSIADEPETFLGAPVAELEAIKAKADAAQARSESIKAANAKLEALQEAEVEPAPSIVTSPIDMTPELQAALVRLRDADAAYLVAIDFPLDGKGSRGPKVAAAREAAKHKEEMVEALCELLHEAEPEPEPTEPVDEPHR